MDFLMVNVFLKILNMSMTATIIILFISLIRLFLRKMPKGISYAIWSIALLRLICPLSIPSSISLLNVFKRWNVPTNQNGLAIVPENIILLVNNDNVTQITTTLTNAQPVTDTLPATNWLAVAATVLWIIGAAAMVIYSIVSFVRLKRKLADAVRVRDQVFETDTTSTPFIFGLVKPRIILPVGLSSMDSTYVLSHEQIHIRRRDYLIKPFTYLVVAIHWFNPFVWLAYFLMSQDMEMSCDERTIRDMNQNMRSQYGHTLLKFSERHPMLSGNILAFGENKIKTRIKNIINYKKPFCWITLICVLIFITTAILLLTNPPALQIDQNKIVPTSFETTSMLSSPQEIRPLPESTTAFDRVSGCLYAVDYVFVHEHIREKTLKFISVDISRMNDWSPTEIARFMAGIKKYDLPILQNTYTELKSTDYADQKGNLIQGAVLEIDIFNITEPIMSICASFRFSGAGVLQLRDDIIYDGHQWAIYMPPMQE